MNIILRRFVLSTLFLTVFTFMHVARAEAGKIIAVFGDAVKKKEPPLGWSYLWNANGEIGNSKNYSPLVYTIQGMDRFYAVVDESGKMIPDTPRNNHPCRSKDGVARFYIASYSMQNDSDGEVWLNNGNIQHRLGGDGDGLMLAVYLNDELKFKSPVKRGREPLLFQQKLGKLKKGDSIYVAVGPGEKSSGYFGMQFTIEELQAGQSPDAPINIMCPEITASEPPRDPDGKYAKWYLNTQRAQCDMALKNKPELAFVGDSITAGWGKVLNEKFSMYKPANFGISGDWIQNMRWRIENGVLDQVNPKVIVVLIGTNNLGNGFTPEEVVEGTRQLVKVLCEKSPKSKILLMGIFPRGKSIKEPICESIRQVNAKTAALADNKTVFFMDITDNLIEQDGTISKEIMPDGLHPAAPGYVRWADAITPVIENIFKGKE